MGEHGTMHARKRGGGATIQRVLAGIVVGFMALTSGVIATAATAAELPKYLAISKTVSKSDLAPGDQFKYEIVVTCSEAACVDAVLTDPLPPELLGFPIVSIETESTGEDAGKMDLDMLWTSASDPIGTTKTPSNVAEGATLSVTPKQDLGGGEFGLLSGVSFSVQLLLKVPEDWGPGKAEGIANTATVGASNAAEVKDTAIINIRREAELGVDLTKAWEPETQKFDEGAASTITLAARNQSNLPLDELVIQEPKAAANGAAELDASNPYTITNFAGFDGSNIDACEGDVRVDAYVLTDGKWNWTEGEFGDSLVLPAGVVNSDVGGIRVTCDGTIDRAETVTLQLESELRGTHRNTGDALDADTHSVTNVAIAKGKSDTFGDTPVDEASDKYTVEPAIPTVETAKNFSDADITAGQSTTVQLTATVGDVPVSTLTVGDKNFFTDDVTFGGFTKAPVWPAGATAATIRYFPLDGSTAIEQTFATGAIPAPHSSKISGFEIVWTGLIEASANTVVDFGVDSTESATGSADTLTMQNTVTADVVAPNGKKASDSDERDLRITNPRISVELEKTVRPNVPVRPGEKVVVSLDTTATAHGEGVKIHDITIEDALSENTEFWNGFDLSRIASTQIPAGASFTVKVRDAAGTWIPLTVQSSKDSAWVFQMSEADINAALPSGTDASDLTGIRFNFNSAEGFSATTNIVPNISFTARSTMRGTSDPVANDGKKVELNNAANVGVGGKTAGGTDLSDDDGDIGTGTATGVPAGPGLGLGISKIWMKDSVAAQSSEAASTQLNWNTTSGFGTVVISDSSETQAPHSPKDTVFDAFNFTGINEVVASNEPYSNGWFMKYDTVTEIKLFDGENWVTLAAPGGSWMTPAGGFKGTGMLSSELSQSALGVQIVMEENTVAREAAQQLGGQFDPFAPLPGSGVAQSSDNRSFMLNWALRDKKRSDANTFVTGHENYNVAGERNEGVVSNTASLTGTPVGGGDPVRDTDADTILIVDMPPGVQVAKSVTVHTEDRNVYTPPAGSNPSLYQTATWSIVGNSNSVSRASYVRLTDPAPCADTNLDACASPATDWNKNPFTTDGSIDYLGYPGIHGSFNEFDVTKLTIGASIGTEVSLDHTRVWLLRFDGTEYSATSHTATEVNNLAADSLVDVIGVSATFQGANPAETGGTITQANRLSIQIDGKLRSHDRKTGDPIILKVPHTQDVKNRVFAQSYDPVAAPDNAKSAATSESKVTLTGGVVNITPTKSVAPETIAEPNRTTPVTVTLGANQGSNPKSTLSPQVVTIEDQAKSPDFWNSFDFVSLGNVSLPAGANRVQVDIFDGTDWVAGVPAETAAIPAGVETTSIQGIRFVFTRADGAFFSPNLPAAGWSASAKFDVKLRDVARDGDAIDFASDVTIENTQTSWSTRPDGANSEKKDATDRVVLTPGTHEVGVHKLTNGGNRIAKVGDQVPFDLTIRNMGTGYLTLTELRDKLPEKLAYTGEKLPEFVADEGGLLSEDVTVVMSEDGSTVVFTWPDDQNVMKPGETFKIRLYLELQPGLAEGEKATNTMTVESVEQLDACYNTVSGGSLTGDYQADNHTCGTTDTVGVVAGRNLFTVKGVQGSLPGAFNPAKPDVECRSTLKAGGESYYRSPCVANSQVDGVDSWVLASTNAGTVPVREMTIFDQLPTPGDSMLIGSSRGSMFRPQLVQDSLRVVAPAGAETVIEVTTSPNVCVGTWGDLENAPVCEQSGEQWVALDTLTDAQWSQVTGIRVHADLSKLDGGRGLKSGQSVNVFFETTNALQTAVHESGASKSVPATDQVAWNQHGVKYQYADETRYRTIAPNKVGTHLRFGEIQVVKQVSGPAAQYAATEFEAEVQCVAGGVELDLSGLNPVKLNEAGQFMSSIGGIPLSKDGTECTVTELGEVGEFGETTRQGDPAQVSVIKVAPFEGSEVPEDQIATITNDYQFTGLNVNKIVETDAIAGAFGPFDFSVECFSRLGEPVTFDDSGSTRLEFTLEDGESWSAPKNRIPVGASCTLTEVDSGHANEIFFSGMGVTVNDDGSATVVTDEADASIQVTNSYNVGTFTLDKVVTGEGAEAFGTGEFTFAVECLYQGVTLFSDSVQLLGGESTVFGPYPTSTTCAVKETGAAGATASTMDPEDGIVVIPELADGEEMSAVTATATNVFDLVPLEVTKRVAGDISVAGAAGPFTVSAECTWLVDGERVPFEIPDGSERELSEANGFEALYELLPASAICELTETETGGAASTTIDANIFGAETSTKGVTATIDMSEVPESEETPVVRVVITNTFASLPLTGGQVSLLAGVGALLIVGGVAALLMIRRRGSAA